MESHDRTGLAIGRQWLEFLQRDYASNFERRLRSPFSVLCMAAVSALLFAFYVNPRVLAVFVSLVAIVLIGCIWPWISMLGFSGSVAFRTDRTIEGRREPLEITLRNGWLLPLWGTTLELGVNCDQNAQHSGYFVPALASRSSQRLEHWHLFGRRGIYPLRRPTASNAFPFGICSARRSLECPKPIIVWPAMLPLPQLDATACSAEMNNGEILVDRSGDSGDVIDIRPYRPGDALRRLHWAQSARHDRLIVCDRQSSRRLSVQVIVDLDPKVHFGAGSQSSLEWCIRIAASLIDACIAANSRVAAAWGTEFFPGGLGEDQRRQLFDSLAAIEEGECDPIEEVLRRREGRGFQGGMQFICTTDRASLPLPLPPRRCVMSLSETDASADDRRSGMFQLSLARPDSIARQLRVAWQDCWRRAVHA